MAAMKTISRNGNDIFNVILGAAVDGESASVYSGSLNYWFGTWSLKYQHTKRAAWL
jgi:hypothetical protein